jgi:hypothetical protein
VVLPTRLFAAEAVVAPIDEGPPGEVIVFIHDGQLSYLEYVYYDDSPPILWPSLDRLVMVIAGGR